MTGVPSSESPLAIVSETAGEEVLEFFEAISDENRLAILLALWEAYDPLAEENVVSFSELRTMVGYEDPGNFRYHLKKLNGTFVDHDEDGYRLRYIGFKLLQTVIAGGARDDSMELTDIDVPCSICDGATGVMYQDGELYQACFECEGAWKSRGLPKGALFREPFPPAGLRNRSPQEIFAAGRFLLHQIMGLKAGGVCPACTGRIDPEVSICEAHDDDIRRTCDACGYPTAIRVDWVCGICKYHGGTSPKNIARYHPAVAAFLYEHGIENGSGMNDIETIRTNRERLETIERTETVISTDPLHIEVIHRCNDDELRLRLDEHMDVLEVSRETPGDD